MNDVTGLAVVERHTQNYAAARSLLKARVQQLMDSIGAEKRRAMPLIQTALHALKAAESELSGAIDENRDAFDKKRTQVMHGVKVGLEKSRGSVFIEDAGGTIDLIKAQLPELAKRLIKKTEKPIKSAIQQLSAQQCKAIGVELRGVGTIIVIRPVDGELEKMIDALLDDRRDRDSGEDE